MPEKILNLLLLFKYWHKESFLILHKPILINISITFPT